MLASRALNSELKKVISNANWLGAQLPLNAGEMHKTLDEVWLAFAFFFFCLPPNAHTRTHARRSNCGF